MMINKKNFVVFLSLILASMVAIGVEAGTCCCDYSGEGNLATGISSSQLCTSYCLGLGGQPPVFFWDPNGRCGQVDCDAKSTTCLNECTTDADCDDGVLCTTDDCVASACENEYDSAISGCSDIFETDCTEDFETHDYFICEEGNLNDAITEDEIIEEDTPGINDFYTRDKIDGFFDETDQEEYTPDSFFDIFSEVDIPGYESCAGDADCEYDQAKEDGDMEKMIQIQMRCASGVIPADQPPCTNDITNDMADIACDKWDEAWENCDLETMEQLLMMHMGGWLGTGTANPTTCFDENAETYLEEYRDTAEGWECAPPGTTEECDPGLFGNKVCNGLCQWEDLCFPDQNGQGCAQSWPPQCIVNDCPPGEDCVSINGACACQPNPIPPPGVQCGNFDVPHCARGACPPGENCENVNGACSCVDPNNPPPFPPFCEEFGPPQCNQGGCPIDEICVASGEEDCHCVPTGMPPISDPNGPYESEVGIPVEFDGSGSYDPDGTIIEYFWTFGDGGTGYGVSPTHTYEAEGEYDVTLRVTGTSPGSVITHDPLDIVTSDTGADIIEGGTPTPIPEFSSIGIIVALIAIAVIALVVLKKKKVQEGEQ